MNRSTLLALLLPVALVAGCGDGSVGKTGDVVGGPCAGDAQCASGSKCLTESDFPGGTCVIKCATDDVCPSGSRCIDKNGGVCLLLCTTVDDCRPGYKCQLRDNFKVGGQSSVCIE